MKINQLFIPAGIFCTLLIGCNPPVKQEAAQSTDDIVWKANLSYCLSREILDAGDLKYGLELENMNTYNFKITEEKGKFKDLMRLLFDSARSKTYPLYAVNPVTCLSPDVLLLPKEKQTLFGDSLWDLKHTKATIINGDLFQLMKGITFNHEFLYDAKAGVLHSTITDATFLEKNSAWGASFVSIAGFKFYNRVIDTLGTDQPGLISSITWGRDLLMPIVDSGQGPNLRTDHSWYNKDSLLEYAVNGVTSKASPLFTQSIRTDFNKKLAEWIWRAARSGQLPAYYCVGTDKIGDQIPLKDLKTFGARTDTVTDEHGKTFLVTMQIDQYSLNGLELKEEIAFHKKSFTFESKITYAGLLTMSVNHNTGVEIHNTANVLYWVKLN